MNRQNIGAVIGCMLLLSGCGSNAPLNRAHEVVFDVPYITNEYTEGDLGIGVKCLSIPEVQELFCSSEALSNDYNVLYMRTKNKGAESYFLNVLNDSLPSRKDIESFFDPHTVLGTVVHVGTMVPVAIGLAALTHDALTFFFSFLGVSMASHIVEGAVLGVSGYEKLATFALTSEPGRGVPGLTIGAYQQYHHLLFMPRRNPNASVLRLSVASKGMVTKEVAIDVNDLAKKARLI